MHARGWALTRQKRVEKNPPAAALFHKWLSIEPDPPPFTAFDAHLIHVEADMNAGNARYFVTVGMPDTAVRESRERIKSALLNSGFGYPNKAVTINLAPANVRKEGVGTFRWPWAQSACWTAASPTASSRPTTPPRPPSPAR